jgi:mannosidase alpha-like ER degradation enhancer 2
MGELEAASATLNAFYIVWREFGFTPEEFDFKDWKLGRHPSKKRYPLRPELIESTMYMYPISYTLTMHSLCTHFALTMYMYHALCTHYALTVHSL